MTAFASKPRRFYARYPLATYFVLAYALSWAVELPLAASTQHWLRVDVPPGLHYMAAFGPALAAVIVLGLTEGRPGLRRLAAALSPRRVVLRWLLIATLAPLGLFGLAVAIQYISTSAWPDLRALGEVEGLPYLGAAGALALWLVTFGLGEELGWRGFALSRLQTHHSALASTIFLGAVWGFWHLPAFFYRATYMTMGLAAGLPLLLLSLIMASIVFTWLYNSARGSLLPVIIFHALFDFLSGTRAGGSTAPALMSTVAMVGAVLIVIFFRPAHLSRAKRQTAPALAADRPVEASGGGLTLARRAGRL